MKITNTKLTKLGARYVNHTKLTKRLSIVVITPSNKRKARQILLVHRHRRVVRGTNLAPCILLVLGERSLSIPSER